MHDKARLELMKSPTICQDSDTVQVTFLHSKQALEQIPQTFSSVQRKTGTESHTISFDVLAKGIYSNKVIR